MSRTICVQFKYTSMGAGKSSLRQEQHAEPLSHLL